MADRVAVITGASSGIGAATGQLLAESGYEVVLGARRVERLEALAAQIGPRARCYELDVSDPASVERFCLKVPACQLLVNNAGGALGDEPISSADLASWRQMYDTNVLGIVHMTKQLLPKLLASADGHIVTIGSVAGFDPYPNSGGYVAAKHAARAVMDVLRLELLGQPIRVSEIDPGMVHTEFSLVRFAGDEERATAMYAGMTPLSPLDVAECVAFVANRPSHVDIDRLVVRPRDQARPTLVHRRPADADVSLADR
ncbi:MAG: sdh 2 [Acidimicrobiaceae bacterium]|nr:sdh 2 [Acidimicrobiaceae bacterium]